MGRHRVQTRDVIIAVLLICLAFGIGFGLGVRSGASQAIELGLSVAAHFVDFEIDEPGLSDAIWRYKNRIAECYRENLTYEIP